MVKNATKSQEEYDKKFDRFLNGYTTERPVLKAEKGKNIIEQKMYNFQPFKVFNDWLSSNPKATTQEVMGKFQSLGFHKHPSESTAIYKPNFAPIKDGSKVVSNFKDMIASKESSAYKNPYIVTGKQSYL